MSETKTLAALRAGHMHLEAMIKATQQSKSITQQDICKLRDRRLVISTGWHQRGGIGSPTRVYALTKRGLEPDALQKYKRPKSGGKKKVAPVEVLPDTNVIVAQAIRTRSALACVWGAA